MEVYIIDEDKKKLEYLKSYFGNDNVSFVNEKFSDFMEKSNVECVVSPGNSFGIMDGGYDLAITKWFGEQLQNRVKSYILDNFYGEQPIGTSFIINANEKGNRLIHTPTMRTPQIIKEPLIVYQCMRSTLMCAYQNNVQSILIPLFGGGYGNVQPITIAKMMKFAYDQINNPPKVINWAYIEKIESL